MKFSLYSNMEALPESAGALFSQSEAGSLFLSQPWIASLVATTADEVVLACVEHQGQTLAILPLIKEDGGGYGALRHRYTSFYSLLLADIKRDDVLECLVQGLKGAGFDALLLEPVSDSDDRLDALQRTMEATGYRCHRYFRFYNWVLKLQGQSFEAYMHARPARLRNTIARKQRKLEREQGYEIRLYTGDEVPASMVDYHAVYGASWKAREQYRDFLDGVVQRFSRRGWSRLAVLYIDDKPAAAQLWFVLHGKASIFRLAYDERWKRYSPGSILTSCLMEYAIETDRVEEIDFLTGNEAYKQDWMSERRERWALSCVNADRPGGRFRSLKAAIRRLFK